MGAGVALQLAIRHPEAVRRLVMISASFRHDGMQPEVLAMIPTITPEMFAGSPMEEAYEAARAATPAASPSWSASSRGSTPRRSRGRRRRSRGIIAPTLIVVGDSDVVTVEHAVELYRLLGGGGFGDLCRPARVAARDPARAPRTSSRRATASSTAADWLLAMIPRFLDAETSAG